jgi:hypothetical protein
MPSKEVFDEYFHKVHIHDEEFNVDNFKPGTSGESQLYAKLVEDMELEEQRRLI